MCVRYLHQDERVVRWARNRQAQLPDEDWRRFDNESFPGSIAPILIDKQLVMAKWGLIPPWAQDEQFGKKNAYNARAETVAEKPTFAAAFRLRRCLVPATAFFERNSGRWIEFTGPDEVMAFAGLYEPPNHLSSGPSFAFVTTEPNDFVAEIHDRMPVILSPEEGDMWMDQHALAADLRALLTPCPVEWLTAVDAGPIGVKRNSGQDSLFEM